MPQMQLPVFPAGAVEINGAIGVQKDAGVVWRLHGHLPLFHHGARDVRSFRMFTSQMIVSGTVKPKEIVKASSSLLVTVKSSPTPDGFTVVHRRTGPAESAAPANKINGFVATAAPASASGKRRDLDGVPGISVVTPVSETTVTERLSPAMLLPSTNSCSVASPGFTLVVSPSSQKFTGSFGASKPNPSANG